MCTHAGCAPHVCFIIPPHIMEHVATHAQDPTLRQRALRNLYHQGRLRGMRESMNQFAFAGLGTGTKRRTVYDAKHGSTLPGTLVRSEGQPDGKDVAVNEAYAYAGQTYDFYFDVLKRNSVDDKGMRLDSSVHYSTDYDNAFWNGQQMVYGDGDGQLFDRFTKCLDVIGHELTHGVTQFTAGLDYNAQQGALNESMSDVFGSLIKQYAAGETADQADWLIGEGLLIPKAGTNRTALRSMKAPGTAYDDPTLGKDPQPATMKDYYSGSDDNQGVHINSGIPNHAFYLAATKIGGKAWEVAGPIWYEVLTTRLKASSDFAEAAAATRDVARKYGAAATTAVDAAWKEVGL
ncbi:MAG: M4 family metallopeptidase [Azospirillaceae bacterium]|nr:M4 family metallopeptidase [Azospirillaceae bacterium]